MLPRSKQTTNDRRGGVLLEFAIVSFVFYVLFSVVVDMGRASFMASSANDAARLMARELALTQLPSNIPFEVALQSFEVRGQYFGGSGPGIFDQRFLAIDLDTYIPAGMTLDEFFGTLPIVNRALRPLMFFDTIDVGGQPREFLRYPGTVVQLDNSSAPYVYTVIVPEVTYAGSSSTIVRWLPVIQEIRSAGPGTLTSLAAWEESPFHASSPEGGIAAVRVNVPFQAATAGGRSLDTNDPQELFATGFQNAVIATQTVNSATNLGDIVGSQSALLQSHSSSIAGAYAGSFGLGSLQILGDEVRPWRKILMAQAIFRREVFAD
jgi:TadE-like protein